MFVNTWRIWTFLHSKEESHFIMRRWNRYKTNSGYSIPSISFTSQLLSPTIPNNALPSSSFQYFPGNYPSILFLSTPAEQDTLPLRCACHAWPTLCFTCSTTIFNLPPFHAADTWICPATNFHKTCRNLIFQLSTPVKSVWTLLNDSGVIRGAEMDREHSMIFLGNQDKNIIYMKPE